MRKLFLAALILTVSITAAWLTYARDSGSGAPVSQAIVALESPSGAPDEPMQSAEPETVSPPSEAGEAQTGEVQERGIFQPERLGDPLRIKPVTPGLTPPISGQFGFMTWNGPWVSAVGGGSVTVDALRSNVRLVDSWEQFRLVPTGSGTYAIQTANGQYLTGQNYAAECCQWYFSA